MLAKIHMYWLFAGSGYGDLQIFGGSTSGILVFRSHNNTWGYVCSSGFDHDAAGVACRQLGYDYGYYSSGDYYYHYG